MSGLRWVVSGTIAGSIVVVSAACREVTEPKTAIAPPDAPSFAASSDRQAPTKPTNLRSTGNTSWSVSLAWNPSTDNSGIASYRVRDNWGREITVPGTQTNVTWKYPAHPPLHNGATYSFSVYAVDAANNK